MADARESAQFGRTSAESALPLIAYRLPGHAEMDIHPSQRRRAWIDETHNRFAARCLPLLIANQAGWTIHLQHGLRVRWSGGDEPEALRLIHSDGPAPYPAASMFGYGIVTFHVPFLFRTPPGYNLLARGPANAPKDGVTALEGLIETDWCVATFTMNWKVTRPNQLIVFEPGEPICMVVPQRRGELEAFEPEVCPLAADQATHDQYRTWGGSRNQFLAGLRLFPKRPPRTAWQRHYFHGTSPGGASAIDHQRKLQLRQFVGAAGEHRPEEHNGHP
jgi:hypothetical protein